MRSRCSSRRQPSSASRASPIWRSRRPVAPAPRRRLEGRIDGALMIALNAQVELDGMSFAEAARRFVAGEIAPSAQARQSFAQRLFAADFGRLALQHVLLVFGSLL